MNSLETKEAEELLRALMSLDKVSEAKKFIRDLLTEQEIAEFSMRWKTARMLYEKVPYSQIESETGLSSATIARISKWLRSGTGGYSLMLQRTSSGKRTSIKTG